MGLSSSQGRLLMLTSRLSDIEFQEIMLSQRQNQLAFKTEEAAKEYNEKMNNYKLVINVDDSKEEKGYKTQDLNYKNMTQMGYLLTNADNQIYLQKDDDGNWIIPKNLKGEDLLSIDSTTGKAKVNDKEYGIVDGTKYISNQDTLQHLIKSGVVFLMNTTENESEISITNIAGEEKMEYVLDTTDDAEAQSKYEYETSRLSRQDNNIEMDIKQLETQHETIAKEYDSVKEVIKSNVERTYNLFSNG